MNKHLHVYVACALTHVPPEQISQFTTLVHDIKNQLKQRGYIVLDFLSALEHNPDPAHVYTYDISCLQKADCVLALGDYPGTGLGYELCYATELRNIPTMVGVTNMNHISKLLKGVSHPHYRCILFMTSQELIDLFITFTTTHYEKNN